MHISKIEWEEDGIRKVKMYHGIIASIVLYNPEIDRLKENIMSISKQVEKILLVDNGSKNVCDIMSLDVVKENCILIRNKENLGLAKALNQAMQYAEDNQYDWVLTLDQDSVCTKNLIEGLHKHLLKERIGIIAPKFIDRNFKRLSDIEKGWKYVHRCITSASLTNVVVWRAIGGFNEKLFIDYVDFDYCARIIRNGYAIIVDSDVEMLHEIGNSRQIFLGNRSYVLYNHSPMRVYYIVRNTLFYCYAYPDVWDVKKEKRELQLRCVMIFLFERKRARKFIAMLKGWKESKKLIFKEKKNKKLKLANNRTQLINYVKKRVKQAYLEQRYER